MPVSGLATVFDLTGRVAVITGGAGLLGVKHAEAVAALGGIPVLLDIDLHKATERAGEISRQYGVRALGLAADVTEIRTLQDALAKLLSAFGRVDILINNAATDSKVGSAGLSGGQASRLEMFSLERWNQEIGVGLTGAFLCSQIFGAELARRGQGVILNIASDLAIIAPDQRIYRREGIPENQQPVKPVTYSVIKSGLLGLTRYLATYWAERGVRANALSPGGVRTDQDQDFVERLSHLIPLARMAHPDEYKAAVAFLVSDASSFMTGANLVMDGGRTAW